MNNPWEEIKLDDYENHMKLDSVKQLETLNDIMKEQFETFSVKTAMVFGVAGGNGLEHVSGDKYNKVFGVDINQDYLDVVSERYKNLSQVLECLKIDLINESEKLPEAQLVIANLLIEYIGYEVFKKAILKGVYLLAGDITDDGKLNSADLLRMKQHLLGIRSIE